MSLELPALVRLGACSAVDARRTSHTVRPPLRSLFLGSCASLVLLASLAWAVPASAAILETRPATSLDDAEESATGSMYYNSTDLELVYDGSNQTVGVRWPGLTIPRGATITAAWIQFTADETQSEATNLLLRAQAADDAAAFSGYKFDLSSRATTLASATWAPVPWTSVGAAGAEQRTPDLSALVQEVVNRPGWASGQALVMVITGTGHRTAVSWDGSASKAPLLHVEYTTGPPPPDAAPVAQLSVSVLASPPLTVNASGANSTDTDATPIASYRFDFGDGTPAVVTNAPTSSTTHTYAAAGTYTVSLQVTDTGGLVSSTVTQSVTVSQADAAPVAQLSVSVLPSPPLTVSASGANSTDTDATPIASYRFDFGDGTPAVVTNAPTSSTTHTYAAAGTYTVSLRVTDTGGLVSGTVTQSVTVSQADAAPVAQLSVSVLASPPLTVSASGANSTDTDATPIASYRFDFGDGTPAVVTNAPTSSTTHTYAAAGTYTVSLQVTDTGGFVSNTVTQSVAVTDVVTTTTVERSVSADGDDAEESATGSVSTTSSDLQLVRDADNQTVGMRWAGLGIPRDATIVSAWIQFTARRSDTEATNLLFRGEATDDAASFSNSRNGISSRPRTLASTAWAPAPWSTRQSGPDQRTPDLSAIVQEIVSRPGWAQDNGLAVIVTGSGRRTAYSYDGNRPRAPMLHVEYVPPPVPEAPPVASLNVTLAPSPPLTVVASGANSTDVDATPIANYRFDFGDGTPAVVTNAPTSSTTHTYAAAGTYTVSLQVTDTGGLVSNTVTQSVTVSQADAAPVAQLSVSVLASPPLTVSASGANSTDTDATPIASYRFDFGDGTPAVVTNAPTSSTTHTYAAAGTYTVTLIATDTGGLASDPVSRTVTVGEPVGGAVAVYVGYYDTHHPDNPQPVPNPWMGDAGVVFVGTPDSPSGGWDSSALRLDNQTNSSLTALVTVDIGSHHYALWGSRTIPAGQKLILAQTAFENFDGSDTNPAGCYGCDPTLCLTQVQSTVPVVHVTIGGVTTDYYDPGQILNTHGVDAAGCPPTSGRNDESHNWVQVFESASAPAAIRVASDRPGTDHAGAAWLAPPFPNPVRESVTLHFSVPSRARVHLALYDLAGRLIETALDTELAAGEYHKVMPLSRLTSGRYFCRLTTSQGTLLQSFVVTR